MKNNTLLILIIIAIINFAFVNPTKTIKKFDKITLISKLNSNGKDLTEKKACTLCHNPEKKIVGPSFQEIAVKYKGDAIKILRFLEGGSEPIVQPEEFQYMKPVMKQLKRSTKEERKAIAEYIAGLK